MRLKRAQKPKKIKKIPKKALDVLTGKERGELISALARRKDFKRKGHSIRFFNHSD